MLKIYGFPSYNTTKVLMTAEELQLNYSYIKLDPSKGENKTPEFLKIHPLGKIPAIEHDGMPLFESGAICRYFAALSGDRQMLPTDHYPKALVEQWMDYGVNHTGRWLSVLFYESVIKPRFYQQQPNTDNINEAKGFLAVQLPPIEAVLQRKPYFGGEAINLADIIHFSYFTTTQFSGYSLAEYPGINTWYEKMVERPSFQKIKQHLSF